ncbi:MAG: fluoride efflux transporter CrcB [Bacteroidales bacterium]|jgi:CrcB protein|nr:fluoride efflux transporter CrcB [Bacteroidales bacterium]
MIQSLLLVGTGGFIGSILRYLVQQWFMQNSTTSIPWGTFAVNIIGSFIFGIIYAFADKHAVFSQEIRLLFAIGFCGGFTTFSSFAAENMNLLTNQDYFSFALYTGLSILSGLIMVWMGINIVKFFV